MALDLSDPMVARLIERLVRLPPAEWDAIDARIRARGATCRVSATDDDEHSPAVRAAVHAFVATIDWLGVRDEVGWTLGRTFQALTPRVQRAMLAPAWRRRGTGPIRRLVEVLERSYVTRDARMYALTVLQAVALRTRLSQQPARDLHGQQMRDRYARWLRDVYAPIEPSIPWQSLLPPALPAASGASR